MLRKMILPLFAVVVAIAAAIAAPLSSQMGWYDSNGTTVGGGLQAAITTPSGLTPVCSVNGISHQCIIKVGSTSFNAFSSKSTAESNDPTGLLKYDN